MVDLSKIESDDPEEEVEEEVAYFHASANNASLFSHDDHYESYWLVDSETAFEECIREIHDRVGEDTNRPHTKWRVIGNVNANVTLLRPSGGVLLMGQLHCIPHHLRQHGMKHFHRHPVTRRVIRDNLCFFRCLSFFMYKNLSHVNELFETVYGTSARVSTYPGISMCEMNNIETIFQIKIQVYKLCRRKKPGLKSSEKKVYVKFVRSSMHTLKGEHVMNLNMLQA